jgi:hypothetical protein
VERAGRGLPCLGRRWCAAAGEDAPSPVRTKLCALHASLSMFDTSLPTIAASEPASRPIPVATNQRRRLTLHEAMIEARRDVDWLTFAALNRKGDGELATPSQLQLRATQSGGRYAHLFEVASGLVRLRES